MSGTRLRVEHLPRLRYGFNGRLQHLPCFLGKRGPISWLNRVYLVSIRNRVERTVLVEFIVLVLRPDDFAITDPLTMLFCSRLVFGIIVLSDPLPRIACLSKGLRPEALTIHCDVW